MTAHSITAPHGFSFFLPFSQTPPSPSLTSQHDVEKSLPTGPKLRRLRRIIHSHTRENPRRHRRPTQTLATGWQLLRGRRPQNRRRRERTRHHAVAQQCSGTGQENRHDRNQRKVPARQGRRVRPNPRIDETSISDRRHQRSRISHHPRRPKRRSQPQPFETNNIQHTRLHGLWIHHDERGESGVDVLQGAADRYPESGAAGEE